MIVILYLTLWLYIVFHNYFKSYNVAFYLSLLIYISQL